MLGEVVRRIPWSSEAEHLGITDLLRDAETEIRGADAKLITPARPVDALKPLAPVAASGELDYDKLAEAMLRAQARATGTPLPQDGTPQAPSTVPGTVQAPAGWTPPTSPDVVGLVPHAGAVAVENDPNAAPASG